MSDPFRRLRMQTTINAVLTLILGIMLTVSPGMAIDTLFLVLGWILVITGIISIVSSLMSGAKPLGQGDLALGLVELATGLVVLSRPGLLVSLCGVILGLILILHGAHDIQSCREARAMGYAWRPTLIVGIVTLAMGALILINPFSTAKLLMRVAGICLIVDAVGDLLLTMRGSR